MSVFVIALVAGVSEGADKISFALNWIINPEHVGYQVAKDRGLWKKRDLEVTMTRGFGSGDTIKKLVGRRHDFGSVDMGTLILGRARGVKAKAIGVVLANGVHNMFTLADSGISSPQDMKGKTIGCPAASSVRILFPSFARANNVDPNSVKWAIMAPAVVYGSLLSNPKIDMVCGYLTDTLSMEAAAKKVGKTVVAIAYSDWGLKIYSSTLAALDEVLTKKPDLARRFVGAALEGWVWAIKNPEEALRISSKWSPELSKQGIRGVHKVALKNAVDEDIAKNGIGYLDREKMKRTRDIALQNSDLRHVKVPLDDLYSNDFLLGIKVR